MQTIINILGNMSEKWVLTIKAKQAQVAKEMDWFIYLTNIYCIAQMC